MAKPSRRQQDELREALESQIEWLQVVTRQLDELGVEPGDGGPIYGVLLVEANLTHVVKRLVAALAAEREAGRQEGVEQAAQAIEAEAQGSAAPGSYDDHSNQLAQLGWILALEKAAAIARSVSVDRQEQP